jgi:CRISP-associated protein Cas1
MYRFTKNCVLIENSTKKKVHLDQVNVIIINTLRSTLTTYLINELIKHKIKVIFCDDKHNPVSELISYRDNVNSPGNIRKQIEWTISDKELMWQKIIETKIDNQQKLLHFFELVSSFELNQFIKSVQYNDITNREGHAAKVYFRGLFGNNFLRHYSDDTNATLDYGYSIIVSYINRIVTSHGYHTALGIHHCNVQNSFNLSYDLVEIFRPWVDRIVYEHRNEPFDKKLKHTLIDVLNTRIGVGKAEYDLQTAIEMIVIDILNNVKNPNYQFKELRFIK